MARNIKFTKTHSPDKCAGRPCIVHNPTNHYMSDWPAIWRYDKGILERVCPCGVGHPDLDMFDYWREIGQEWRGVHGCCGVCFTSDEDRSCG